MSIRLQSIISRNSQISRRGAEQAIALGRVTVNGIVATLGTKADIGDTVRIDGKPIPIVFTQVPPRVLAYHKPIGEECSHKSTRSVFQHLPEASRSWIHIGRLDINTSGILLFTNDGMLSHRLCHPSNKVDREYAVRVRGNFSTHTMEVLQKGVQLDDGLAKFLDIVDAGGTNNRWLYVVVQEGRNRLVRRLCESQGLQVSRLVRVRFGSVMLPPRLRSGRWSELSFAEVTDLYMLAGLDLPRITPVSHTQQKNRLTKPREIKVKTKLDFVQKAMQKPPGQKTLRRSKKLIVSKKNAQQSFPEANSYQKRAQSKAVHAKSSNKHQHPTTATSRTFVAARTTNTATKRALFERTRANPAEAKSSKKNYRGSVLKTAKRLGSQKIPSKNTKHT